MREISTSIYTFADLRKYDCLYVDKTRYIYQLLRAAKGQFFCARPRRFGKSLTVSTLKAVFQGKREMFEGLFLSGTDYAWPVHPVIHIDFGRYDCSTVALMEQSLQMELRYTAKEYGVEAGGESAAVMFGDLIRKLHEKYACGVVLLIDEYDKPIIGHVEDAGDAEAFRRALESFYQIIKGAEALLRFVFLTGVTKFAKVSIFSKLNNLTDISMSVDYATMFGYTQEELEQSFSEHLEALSRQERRSGTGRGMTMGELLSEVKFWYDGFCFADESETVYNPVSIGKFFYNNGVFQNYWFETGTPTFLLRLLLGKNMFLTDMVEASMSVDSLATFNLVDLSGHNVPFERAVQLLFQTGYLTLDHLLDMGKLRSFALRFPNFEVRSSFEVGLLTTYERFSEPDTYAVKLFRAAMSGATALIIDYLREFFAGLSYDIQVKQEKYHQSIVYTIFRMCGMEMQTEVTTNIGRIDGVLDTDGHLYIIEFKLDKSAAEAVWQIDTQKYAEKYIRPAREKGQMVHALGINFSYEQGVRNITDWQEEILGE
ncbi:MAG: hypothetical protein E7200_11450 [Selenomonas ruminantium]|nr:hypothetical protein [Selenomonas ruminantium]